MLQTTVASHKQDVARLKQELKTIKERRKVVREKDADGNEREVITTETDTTEQSSESERIVTELRTEITLKQAEIERLKKSSSPMGGVAAGASPGGWYFRANYSVLGPVGLDFVHTNDNIFSDPSYFVGVSWSF